MATAQMNQSFREQEEEDEEYEEDEQDANIFDATKIPENYDKNEEYYEEGEEQSTQK